MKTRTYVVLLLGAAASLSSLACVSTVFRSTSDLSFASCPPVAPSSVRVLSRPPSKSFTVLGEVEAYVTGYHSDEEVLGRLRTKAAQNGAHAIFFVRDVPMRTAASRMLAEYDAPLDDRTWHKRSSLVYMAVRFTDVPEPCAGTRRLTPACSGLAALATDARR